VSTNWVDKHRLDSNVRIVEVDVDASAYDEGHIPGSIAWAWNKQLCDVVRRDILAKRAFQALMEEAGIENDTIVILYGDNNNWFAAWPSGNEDLRAPDVRMMNGGRKRGSGRAGDNHDQAQDELDPLHRRRGDMSLRALLPAVQSAGGDHGMDLVDVRSPLEFSGEILAPPGLPETCQRGGHIPHARNIPWSDVCNEDGTFKSADELKALYAAQGIDGSKPVIAYCRIGERSSHTWFVLKYLLGFRDVANYDGSWTEWGNLVRAPVEKGPASSR